MQTVENKKNRLLAAADIVDRGEMAVVEKIYDFMEFLEENDVKLSEFFAKIEADILSYKENINTELSMGVTPISELVTELKGDCEEMEDKMGKTHEMMLSEVQSIKSKMTNLVSEIQKVRSEIPEMPEETDLTDIYNRLVEIEGKIPTIPAELTAYQVRDKLESIDNESEKLKIEAIKDLRAELDELKKGLKSFGGRPIFGGGFNYSAMDLHIVDDETPAGTVNDVNTDFTLAHVPNPASSLKVYVNGQRMRITTDYTFSGGTISFVTAPPTGSILLVDYRQ